jgi:hypothetical protein
MTSPAYNPAVPAAYPPGGRLSKSALTSFILGILGCIPFITGALALVAGIIGFVKTGKPGVKGRWMAILGSVLGVASLLFWTVWVVMFGAIFAGALALTQAPRTASHDFLREISAGNVAAAKAHAPDISDEALKGLHEGVSEWGNFVDTTFTTTNVNNDSAHLEGTAQFAKGTHRVVVDLESKDGKWEIQSIRFPDDSKD